MKEVSKGTSRLPLSSGTAPLAVIPSAPPGKTVKGGEKAGSSGSSGGRRGAVSMVKDQISKITGPKSSNKWK